MVKALILDFDGLMVDTESALIGAYGDIHAEHGIPFHAADFLLSVGHADYTFDPWRSFPPEADRLTLEEERRRRNREREVHLPLLPGVGELLENALAAGLQLGLASNSSHVHVDGHLRRRGLYGKFSVIACRNDVASPKPEPDVYKFALNRLGRRGREAIAFEDSATGTIAARRAALHVIAIPNPCTAHHDFSQAHQKLTTLAGLDLPQLISRLSPPQAV